MSPRQACMQQVYSTINVLYSKHIMHINVRINASRGAPWMDVHICRRCILSFNGKQWLLKVCKRRRSSASDSSGMSSNSDLHTSPMQIRLAYKLNLCPWRQSMLDVMERKDVLYAVHSEILGMVRRLCRTTSIYPTSRIRVNRWTNRILASANKLCSQAREGHTAVQSIAGIDLDPQAVKRGIKRMCSRGLTQGHSSSPIHLRLFQGDISCEAARNSGTAPAKTWCRRLIFCAKVASPWGSEMAVTRCSWPSKKILIHTFPRATAIEDQASRLLQIEHGSQNISAPTVSSACQLNSKEQAMLSSAAEVWGEFVGVELAIFQEVIEHLDPYPLQLLPSCLLGALQPMTLVISTPNYEYNAILHGLSSQLLPNGLRNSDHRFEWWLPDLLSFCGWNNLAHVVKMTFCQLLCYQAVSKVIVKASYKDHRWDESQIESL